MEAIRLLQRLAGLVSAIVGLALIAACSADSAGQIVAKNRPEAYWPDRAIVFLADQEAGVVRSFSVRSGVAPLGRMVTPSRAAVLALSLDISAQRLWVLDGGALHAYDANTLKLVRRWSAPGAIILKALELDLNGDLLVVAADGHRYHPDPASFALRAVAVAGHLAASNLAPS